MTLNKPLFAFLSVLLITTWACAAIDSIPDIIDDAISELDSNIDIDSNILYQDDFSDSSSGWADERDEFSFTGYQNGAYRIEVTEDFSDVWVTAGVGFADVSIQVEATKIGGDDDNDFGLLCRATDINNFYAAVISSDGFYGLFQNTDGELKLMNGEESMLDSEAINQGDATNMLRLDCVGSSIKFFVNGQLIAEAENNDIFSGDVGFLVGTFEDPLADISFDNFVVTKP